MEVQMQLRNIKKIESLEVKFLSGHLYFVRGSNEKGKTTFTNAIPTCLTGVVDKDALTRGEKDGYYELMLTDGSSTKVTIDLKESKSPKFTIITPDLRMSSKKTDLTRLFGYTHIGTDEFLALGTSEPGRRKQAAFFIELMPLEVKKQLNQIEGEINTSNGSTYIDRRDAGVLLKNMVKPEEPTEEEKELAQNYQKWNAEVYDMEQDLNNAVLEVEKTKLTIKNLELQLYAGKWMSLTKSFSI